MSLPLIIAIRYIFSRKSFHFITIITITSILGIIVGVAALIVVMSIFGGFRTLTENQIVGFDPHIRLISKNKMLLNDSLMSIIKNVDGVEIVSKAYQGRAALMYKSSIQVVNLKLFDARDMNFYNTIAQKTQIGKFDLSVRDGFPKISLGIAIADKLRAFPGDTIFLMSPDMFERTLLTYQKQSGFRAVVSGIFQTNIKDYDYLYAFSSLKIAEKLFKNLSGEMNSIEVRVKSFNAVDKVVNKIKIILPSEINIQTWKDLNKELFSIMEFEKYSSFTILTLIVLIAVFNILASLSMTVTEKQADIAILKSLGARDKQISLTYILEGLLIGLIGTAIGALIGVLLCIGQLEFSWVKIDSTKYIIDAIPVQISVVDVTVVCIVSICLSFLATIYPARRASSSSITQFLRNE